MGYVAGMKTLDLLALISRGHKEDGNLQLQCDICRNWSHFFCLRQTKHLIEVPKEDEMWFCPACNRC